MARARKTLETFKEATEAPGYQSSLVLKYINYDGDETSASFKRFGTTLGPIVGQLVAAAIRVKKPSHSHRGYPLILSTLRQFLLYLDTKQWDPQFDVRSLKAEHVLEFAEKIKNDSTANATFRLLRQIVVEALRPEGLSLKFPYGGIGRSPTLRGKPELSELGIKLILAAARKDVDRVWREFQQYRSSNLTLEMREVAAIAAKHDGILPRFKDDKAFLALQDRYKRLGITTMMKRWSAWIAATNESLLPFLILVLYGLAGNVVALIDAKRGLMQLRDDPIRGRRAVISLLKHRSSRVLQYGFKDVGRYSVPALIRQILEMTEPLVRHVKVRDRDRLLLVINVQGTRGKIAPKISAYNRAHSWTIRNFCEQHDLREQNGERLKFTLDMLRPTRINAIYRKTDDIFIAQKMAHHKSHETTFKYLRQFSTIERGNMMLADIQGDLATREVAAAPAINDLSFQYAERARSLDRDCLDPLNPPNRSDSACPRWNHTLNDPNLVIPPEPRFIAALLRDREAYRAARQRISYKRFTMLYSDRLQILDDILKRFEDDEPLMCAAQKISAVMAPPPEII